jgi:hypothetical protein
MRDRRPSAKNVALIPTAPESGGLWVQIVPVSAGLTHEYSVNPVPRFILPGAPSGRVP